MASESILGTINVTLPPQATNLLDKYLSDTNSASLKQSNAGNGATVIVSSGGNGDVNIAITPPNKTTSGSLSDGNGKNLEFQLPANLGLVSKSTDANSKGNARDYVDSVLDKYIPDNASGAVAAQKQAIIDALTKALDLVSPGASLNVTIRNIDFFTGVSTGVGSVEDDEQQSFAILDSDGTYQGVDSLVGANDVLLDAGASSGNQLFVINLAGLTGKTLALQNVEGAVLAAGGTVKVEGSTAIRITSDNQAQNITGGGGNDTLVGTGSDTLAGGAGNDVFGFAGAGKYTVSDFNKGGDMLAFDIAGVANVDQLKAKVTSVVKTSTSITYNLGADTSITLVGVSASDLTASMLTYTITG
ncbi:MAG: hypothetical protein V4603_18260 [Pseudomonadota bacterium]